jgi:hypothetical protein
MSVTLNLAPETEQKLRACAAQVGQSFEKFVQDLVEKAVTGPKSGSSDFPASLPSDMALELFRQEVQDSGMTDDELHALFDDARDEVYPEKQGRPGKNA